MTGYKTDMFYLMVQDCEVRSSEYKKYELSRTKGQVPCRASECTKREDMLKTRKTLNLHVRVTTHNEYKYTHKSANARRVQRTRDGEDTSA